MENNLKFNSAICTSRVQSERLLALGLKPETADMVYHYTKSRCKSLEWELQPHSPILRTNTHLNIEKLNVFGHKNSDGKVMTGEEYFDELWGKDIPAWSLHRLIEMMPKCVMAHSIGDDSPRLHPYVPKLDYQGVTIENIDEILADFYEHTDLFDNIIDCIEWLIKEGYFNKEYLV